MSGARVIWIASAIVLVGGAVALLVPAPGDDSPRADLAREPSGSAADGAQVVVTAPTRAPQPATAPAALGASTTPASLPATPAQAPVRAPVVREADAIDDGLKAVIRDTHILEGNIVPRKDETTGDPFLLADGRYRIRGAGTFENPYRVTWDCLASARDTYNPRLQEFDLPQRVAMLNGKWLRIDGYLAFPLMVSQSRDVLIMLNQWDGCCIGVPPTPYDAIEVKLIEPARRSSGHALFSFGGVLGKLRVDPLVTKGWLQGLYVLDDAVLIKDVQPEL